MIAAHRQRIERAFAGADDYDRHAGVQRAVANRLAGRIAAVPLPARPRVLEIGCGTGFLTEALIGHGIGGEWLITDIAPEMVERCRARIGEAPGRRFAVLDGEYGVPEPHRGFDLICSSLAMQWFDDHGAAIGRMLGWLAPEGHCLFATLGAGSFAEWRAAHAREGIVPGTPPFLDAAAFDAIRPEARCEAHTVERVVEPHDDALDFLRSLKAIGAQTADRLHRPLDPATLRRVMRNFDEAGPRATYEVVIGHYRRDSQP